MDTEHSNGKTRNRIGEVWSAAIQNPWKLPRLLIALLIVAPLSLIWPKKKGLIVVIGRGESGNFEGNAKYFYLYLVSQMKDVRNVSFLTNDHETYEELRDRELPVFLNRYPEKIKLLRAETIVVDSNGWIKNETYHWALGSKKIQLWHGAVPLKRGERDSMHERGFARSLFGKIHNFLLGRFPKYDLLVIGHEQFREVYQSEFEPKRMEVLGYPRNDIHLGQDSISGAMRDSLLIGVDREAKRAIVEHRNQGKKVIWYTPTFRDSGRDPFQTDALDLPAFLSWLEDRRCVLLLSYHPYSTRTYCFDGLTNLIVAEQGKDIYPLLTYTDLLITDYSSIYFDYLLTERPILFFQYDLEAYLTKERELMDGFENLMPGPRCRSQDDMKAWIEKLLFEEREDSFKTERKRVKESVFQYQDGKSSERIWNAMQNLDL